MLNNMKERFAEIGRTLQETTQEEAILTAACGGDWETALPLVEGMDRPVDRDAAELCLGFALQGASEETFDRLLGLLPKGEYVGEVYLRNVLPEQDVTVVGSLAMLAAAQGMTEKLRSLLEHGWDVNSASLDIAERLHRRAGSMDPFCRASLCRTEPCSARCESILQISSHINDGYFPGAVRSVLPGATPLAAAILCGQRACVEVLLAHGAWKEEAPSVTRALTQRNRDDDEAYQACREAVLTWGDAPRPMTLWTVVRSMTEEALAEELRRCRYEEGAIAKCVWELATGYRMMPSRGPWAEERKRDFTRLQLLEQHYPQVLRRPELVGAILRQCMLQNVTEEWGDFALSLCPERLDLSLLREGLVRTPAKKTRAFLLRICQGRSCVMDRDSVPPATPVSVLHILLDQVEFLPAASDRSVSGLTYAILHSGNLQLIRKALLTGIIPAEEPTQLLLQCLGDIPGATTARTLLLTVPRFPRAEAGGWFEHRKKLLHGLGFRWMPEDLQQESYGALLEETCPEALERELVQRSLYDYRTRVEYDSGDGRWEVDSLLNLLCWRGRDRVVERLVRCGPEELLQTVSKIRPAGEAHTLVATPLCVAAFAGQKQVVETLLGHGAEADEARAGYPSTLIWNEAGKTLPITPLLAAVARGHWDIARLLMDHGARCDLTQHTAQQLWRLYQKEDLHQVVQAGILAAGEAASLTPSLQKRYN